jgi:hypothetical protein
MIMVLKLMKDLPLMLKICNENPGNSGQVSSFLAAFCFKFYKKTATFYVF